MTAGRWIRGDAAVAEGAAYARCKSIMSGSGLNAMGLGVIDNSGAFDAWEMV